ncbi:MAG: M14 family metallopeptidase [Deltaproteobacteria bacterium]|jgi:hypothetical protein|nr:M14 family metallopeptidase [Deltaproteobacteria bacterium]
MKKWIKATLWAFSLTFALSGLSHADIDFSNFHSPSQVDTILNELVAAYPGLAQLSTIGTSHGGMPIKALKISDNVATDESDEGDVLFVAMHHAREWISVEMALYLAEQILSQYSTNPQLQADVNNLEIWIVPVVNPDGFAYTWSPSGYRFWRKNRRNNGDGTFGVDLNRNWGYEWGLSSGSSGSTSSDMYRGPAAFSEPEISALRTFVNGLDNLKTMLTYHSFSELFLRPWGYTTMDASGEETLRQLALRSINVIQAVHGHTYSETIGYTASGETTDWFWGEHRVSAFTPELRPASGGLGGFDPPPAEIVPSNQENLPAALALIHDAGARELWMKDYAADTGVEPSAVWTGTNWSHAFWVSPDIWTVPATLDQGATVDLNIRIRNNIGTTQTNVRLDIYYTDPRISLEFPNPDATLIASRTSLTVPSGGTTVTVPWTVPVGTNSWGERHWCVGAIVMHDSDLPLTTEARRSSNVAIRNFNTTETVVGTNLVVAATNYLDVDAELMVFVDDLPPGWQVVLPPRPKPVERKKLTSIERKGLLVGAKGRLLRPGDTIYLPVRVIPPSTAGTGDKVDINVHGGLLPLVAGKRTAVGNGFTYQVVVP